MLDFNPIIFFILSFISGLISAIIGIGPITIMILKVYLFIILFNSIVLKNKLNMQNILL